MNRDKIKYEIAKAINGRFSWGPNPANIKIIELPDEQTYPKEMQAWDNDKNDYKICTIIGDLGENVKYRYVGFASTASELQGQYVGYENAICVPAKITLTIEQIAEKFNVDPNNLIIITASQK